MVKNGVSLWGCLLLVLVSVIGIQPAFGQHLRKAFPKLNVDCEAGPLSTGSYFTRLLTSAAMQANMACSAEKCSGGFFDSCELDTFKLGLNPKGEVVYTDIQCTNQGGNKGLLKVLDRLRSKPTEARMNEVLEQLVEVTNPKQGSTHKQLMKELLGKFGSDPKTAARESNEFLTLLDHFGAPLDPCLNSRSVNQFLKNPNLAKVRQCDLVAGVFSTIQAKASELAPASPQDIPEPRTPFSGETSIGGVQVKVDPPGYVNTSVTFAEPIEIKSRDKFNEKKKSSTEFGEKKKIQFYKNEEQTFLNHLQNGTEMPLIERDQACSRVTYGKKCAILHFGSKTVTVYDQDVNYLLYLLSVRQTTNKAEAGEVVKRSASSRHE